MKKMIAFLVMAISATAFAKGTTPQVMDSSVSYVAPCWVQISNTSIVDGRRVAGFAKQNDDIVKVYSGTTNDYNAIYVTVKGGKPAQDAYIADIQNRVNKCYQ